MRAVDHLILLLFTEFSGKNEGCARPPEGTPGSLVVGHQPAGRRDSWREQPSPHQSDEATPNRRKRKAGMITSEESASVPGERRALYRAWLKPV